MGLLIAVFHYLSEIVVKLQSDSPQQSAAK